MKPHTKYRNVAVGEQFDRLLTVTRLSASEFLVLLINIELGRHDSKPHGGSWQDWFDNDSYNLTCEKSARRVTAMLVERKNLTRRHYFSCFRRHVRGDPCTFRIPSLLGVLTYL